MKPMSITRLFAVILAFTLSCLLVTGCDDVTERQAEIEQLQEENRQLARSLHDLSERMQTLERQLDIAPQPARASERSQPAQTDRDVIPALGDDLIQAIIDGNELLAIALVEEGAPVDAANEQGMTALHAAVRASMLDLSRLLLEKGADADATTPRSNQTPMHWASRIGAQDRDHAREIVDLLLEYGADINHTDANGFLPTYYPLQLEHPEWLQFMVSRGATIN